MCEDEAGGQQHAFILRDIRQPLSQKMFDVIWDEKTEKIIPEETKDTMNQQEEPENHCGGRRGAGASVLGQQLGVPKTDYFPVVIVKETGTAVEEQKALLLHLQPDNWSPRSVAEAGNVVSLDLCQEQAREGEIAGRRSAWVSKENAGGLSGQC